MKELFISYAHTDEDLRKELGKHLMSLKRLGQITTWYDRLILPGSEFANEIDKNIESADLILLLISPDFIASEYCYDIEMQRAMERHNNGSAVILPIILRPCYWQDLPFGKLLAATPDGTPVIKYPSLDDGFLDVINSIKKIVSNQNPHEFEQAATLDHDSIEIVEVNRSSNLNVRKEFSDLEKADFEKESYEYIVNYFENSLAELSKRNVNLTYRSERIDSITFECRVYIDGVEKTACIINRGKKSFIRSGITFSYGSNHQGISENLIVEDDGYIQYLSPMMGQLRDSSSDRSLTMQGGAELLWDMLIRELQ